MIIFGERLDNLSLLGSVIIIGTGLYTFLRERRLGMEKEQLKQNLSN